MQIGTWYSLGWLSGEAGKGLHLVTAGRVEESSYMPTHSLEEDEEVGPGEEEEADPEGAQPTCLTTSAFGTT